MAGSINKVILVGNLGKAPEVRFGQDGSKIVTFPIATSETWKDRTTGERKDRTEWHKVVIFNDKLGEIAEKYLQKGSKIFVEGQLQTRKWTDTSGQERYTTEVVLSKFRGEMTLLEGRAAVEGEVSVASSKSADVAGKASDDDKKFDDLNDTIPF
jgi:single-strand DNA-binding protein